MTFRMIFVGLVFSTFGAFAADFPTTPDQKLTPGELCSHPDTYRYPEKVAYCERDVGHQTKGVIIDEYDRQFGYRIDQMNRQDFKIDHHIPLCAGGSNTKENLWPQHKSVYELTDAIENDVCQLMALGSMLQKDVVELVRNVKQNPRTGPEVHNKLALRIRSGKKDHLQIMAFQP